MKSIAWKEVLAETLKTEASNKQTFVYASYAGNDYLMNVGAIRVTIAQCSLIGLPL